MALHNEKGVLGEQLARNFLIANGYQILKTNWRFGRKEIDIIARKEKTIAIVEVKLRTTDYYGKPEEAVGRQKQQFLIEAADAYLEELIDDYEVRFDIISIIKNTRGTEIRHIKEAFIPWAN